MGLLHRSPGSSEYLQHHRIGYVTELPELKAELWVVKDEHRGQVGVAVDTALDNRHRLFVADSFGRRQKMRPLQQKVVTVPCRVHKPAARVVDDVVPVDKLERGVEGRHVGEALDFGGALHSGELGVACPALEVA
jgi:hypothetical protein